MATTRRPLAWEGSAKEDFKSFPTAVQKDMGVALYLVQLGGTPPSATPFKGLGQGTFELREAYRGDAYRTIYTVRVRSEVHVLHAFKKKSKSGIETPMKDVQLVERRMKALMARFRDAGRR